MGDLLSFSSSADFWVFVGAIGASLSGLAGIALAVIAGFGLKSLRLAQRDMLNRATRDARNCAIDRCRDLAKTLIPSHGKALRPLKAKKVPVFVQRPEDVGFGDEREYEQRSSAAKWIGDGLDSDDFKACVALLNELEVWASYFTAALADEKVAYGPCSPVFLGMVVQLYPLLIHLRGNDQSGNYPAVVTLFGSWYAKANEEAILEQARKLQTLGGQYKLPTPIGTEPLK